ncbi:LapA family protein [Aliiglaciecola litoralis]|uniref:Lipopolysaccharide assembly protein A domain-containing protein n=1 Tax=Aliiglaciecola litoralis TaxID=582857 RepID=A0ABP3X3P2_9ALTE
MHKLSKYFIIALIALCAIFVLQNLQTVTVSFLFWEFSLPRAALVCVMLLIGLIIGMLVNSSRRMLFKE